MHNLQQGTIFSGNGGKIGKQITEKYANMNDNAARRFGKYIRELRTKRGYSARKLAALASIDSGTVTRLEQGGIHAPNPGRLKHLADALEVPLADLFAMAGYVTTQELPSIAPYLAAKYGYLPEDARDDMAAYCRQRAAERTTFNEDQRSGVRRP
ncbi:hypothetical protein GCM10023192_34870 [Amycolatopsis samaneae]